MNQTLAVLTRSGFIESMHAGFICVTDSNRKVIFSIGDPETKVFMRSAAKPLQALPLVQSGALEKFKITQMELAAICASHSGQEFHLQAVSSILDKIGLSEENLGCGVANPYNDETLNNLIRNGVKPSQLYNTCSGTHAGMLALCRFYGYPVEDYVKPEHPVQKLIHDVISELLECEPCNLETGMDGCDIPTFILTMKQGAYLYSLLSQGSAGNSRYMDSLEIIKDAMTSYPSIISGHAEFCTDLILKSGGKAIGKIGAEGMYCIAAPEKKIGICIKISDGRERATYPVTLHILRQFDILDDEAFNSLSIWAYPPLKNHKGHLVGYTIPVFDINDASKADLYSIGDKLEPESLMLTSSL